MPKTNEVVRMRVDDGYPESGDYECGYVVVPRPPRPGLWRSVRDGVQRTLRWLTNALR